MGTVDTTPTAQRWPAAAWWVPLLRDLLLLEAANTGTGFLVSRLDLAERPPRVSASTVDCQSVTVHVDAEIGTTALRQRLHRAGLALPEPALDSMHLLQTPHAEASPWLVHAWVLDALSNSDAFPGCLPQERSRRVDLRDIRGDTTRIDVTLHLVAHGYGIRIPVLLDDPDNDYSGVEYALTERALALHPEQLEPLEPHHGLTTYLGPAHSATGWETPGHEPHG
jgi:hypothetical protein